MYKRQILYQSILAWGNPEDSFSDNLIISLISVSYTHLFGKSLTLNMLQHYYDVRTKDKFDSLFGCLLYTSHNILFNKRVDWKIIKWIMTVMVIIHFILPFRDNIHKKSVSYTHLDVYKRQVYYIYRQSQPYHHQGTFYDLLTTLFCRGLGILLLFPVV